LSEHVYRAKLTRDRQARAYKDMSCWLETVIKMSVYPLSVRLGLPSVMRQYKYIVKILSQFGSPALLSFSELNRIP